MTIQLNTDKNIDGNDRLKNFVNSTISEELARFSEHITRVEVHLSDENGAKQGENDKKCVLEARIKNKQPIAVTTYANTLEKAVNGSLTKLKSSVDSIMGKLEKY